MKNKILYLVSAIMIFVSIYEITDSYGLFESETNRTVDSNIAKWNISINNTMINSTETFVVDNFTLLDNNLVSSGKLAPGVTGYFDIIIDAGNTDVSVRYDLTFDFTNVTNNFTVSKIEETGGNNVIRTGEFTYSNVLKLNDIKNNITNNIRVYLMWENKEENNSLDSEIGLTENNFISIPVSITVSQYLNEEIVPYVEKVA